VQLVREAMKQKFLQPKENNGRNTLEIHVNKPPPKLDDISMMSPLNQTIASQNRSKSPINTRLMYLSNQSNQEKEPKVFERLAAYSNYKTSLNYIRRNVKED